MLSCDMFCTSDFTSHPEIIALCQNSYILHAGVMSFNSLYPYKGYGWHTYTTTAHMDQFMHESALFWLNLTDGEIFSGGPVISGVPQGSVFGLILFLVFITNMPEVIQSTYGTCCSSLKMQLNTCIKEENTPAAHLHPKGRSIRKWWELVFKSPSVYHTCL